MCFLIIEWNGITRVKRNKFPNFPFLHHFAVYGLLIFNFCFIPSWASNFCRIRCLKFVEAFAPHELRRKVFAQFSNGFEFFLREVFWFIKLGLVIFRIEIVQSWRNVFQFQLSMKIKWNEIRKVHLSPSNSKYLIIYSFSYIYYFHQLSSRLRQHGYKLQCWPKRSNLLVF